MAFLFVYEKISGIYPTIMSWGSREIDQYRQPNGFVLGFFAFWLLFWFPVEEEWQVRAVPSQSQSIGDHSSAADSSTLSQSRKERENSIYIGNQQLYGLGTISLVCSIYRHTKQLPRTLVPPFHFKIPFWKHLIEYFGAVPDSSSLICLENIVFAGQSVLFFPGGSCAFFTPPDKDKMYSFDSFHPKNLDKIVDLLIRFPTYSVSCFSNVGASEMITCVGSIPFPMSLLDGDFDVSGTPPVDSRPVPGITFFIPTSYQRQFMVFSPPITYKHIQDKVSSSSSQTNSNMPLYMPILKQTGSARADCLDLQHMAKDSKFLLSSFSFVARKMGNTNVVRKSASQIGEVMGHVGRRMGSGIVSLGLGLGLGLGNDDHFPGPIIKEIQDESEE